MNALLPCGALALLAMPYAAFAAENSLPRYDANAAATMEIDAGRGHGSSGALAPDGYLLTCGHVISGRGISTVALDDVINGTKVKVQYPVTLVASSKRLDLAVVKIGHRLEQTIRFAENSAIHTSMHVYGIGFPYTLGQLVSDGIVMQRSMTLDHNPAEGILMLTDMVFTYGASGGNTFDATTGLYVGTICSTPTLTLPTPNSRTPLQFIFTAVSSVESIRPFLEKYHVPYVDAVGKVKTYAGDPPENTDDAIDPP